MPILRLLIAEEKQEAADLLRSLAEREGHIICGSAANRGEVMHAVENLQPDGVLLGVRLADGSSGIELARELLATARVPVIMTSSPFGDLKDFEAIAQSGALGVLKSPPSLEDLRLNLRIAAHHNTLARRFPDRAALYRTLLENAAVGFYVCHPDGSCLASNHAFARLLGYGNPFEILRLTHSRDEQIYIEKDRREYFLARLRLGEKIQNAESRVYGRDGESIWISEYMSPYFDAEGSLAFYEGIAFDISARKRAEDEKNLALNLLRTALNAIGDCIAVTDLAGNIILSNRAFERRLSPFSGPTRQLQSCLCREGKLLFAKFLQSIQPEQNILPPVRGILHIKGYEGELDTAIFPYPDAQGAVVGAVLVMRSPPRFPSS